MCVNVRTGVQGGSVKRGKGGVKERLIEERYRVRLLKSPEKQYMGEKKKEKRIKLCVRLKVKKQCVCWWCARQRPTIKKRDRRKPTE